MKGLFDLLPSELIPGALYRSRVEGHEKIIERSCDDGTTWAPIKKTNAQQTTELTFDERLDWECDFRTALVGAAGAHPHPHTIVRRACAIADAALALRKSRWPK